MQGTGWGKSCQELTFVTGICTKGVEKLASRCLVQVVALKPNSWRSGLLQLPFPGFAQYWVVVEGPLLLYCIPLAEMRKVAQAGGVYDTRLHPAQTFVLPDHGCVMFAVSVAGHSTEL